MNLLSWPSKKNFLNAVIALEKLENSNLEFIRPVHISMALEISQREARFLLEAAERVNAVSAFFFITCPSCRSPYNIYSSELEIPATTDQCDVCHKSSCIITSRDIEKVYKLNERK